MDLNYLLIFVIISGAISVLTNKPEENLSKPEPITKRDYTFIIFAGIFGSLIVFYKIQDLEWNINNSSIIFNIRGG